MARPKVAERLLTLVGSEDEALLLGLQALADPVRLHMLRLLAEREQCVCHLTAALGLSQASISHHVAVLKRAGLVRDRRDARWTYYSLSAEAASHLRQSVDDLLDVGSTDLASAACCDPLEGQVLSPETSAEGKPAPIALASFNPALSSAVPASEVPASRRTQSRTHSQTQPQRRCH